MSSESEVINKQPKKRGRKPKNYVKPEEEPSTVVVKKKKRGRKPKNKFNVETNFEEYNTLSANNTNHIIKIPINCLEEEQMGHSTLLTDIIDTAEPAMIGNENLNYEYNTNCDFYNNEMEFEQSVKHLFQNYLLGINELDKKDKYISIVENILEDIKKNNNKDKMNEYFANNTKSLIPNDKNNFSKINKINEDNIVNNDYYTNKKNEIFNDLHNENLSQIEILINKKYRHTKQISLLHSVCKNVNEGEWLKKTDLCCFWCCHNFDNIPWGLPTKYENEKFTLTGIYCSPNCAMAHLLNTEKNNNTLWEKIVLLNLLHHKIYGTDENIVPAPDKICLKAFGGPFDINEYRYLTLENKKNYEITFPPCNIVAPVLEETKKLTNQDNYFIPIDMNKVNKINAELKIKRRKVKQHTNSIFNFSNE